VDSFPSFDYSKEWFEVRSFKMEKSYSEQVGIAAIKVCEFFQVV